ncbi:MAG TPA: HAMP domain-containing sensor histidine kinase [Jatrophihabitantaceae bacterium]
MTRLASPRNWWARQSLRARLTLLATSLFTIAVVSGAVLVLVLQRYALLRTLDSSAQKTAHDIAQSIGSGKVPSTFAPTTGGVVAGQIVDANDQVISACCGSDRVVPLVDHAQLTEIRAGGRVQVTLSPNEQRLRIVGVADGSRTVLAATDPKNVDDSLRLLSLVALIGAPLAILLMALATYGVVALTLRSVAELRHGATAITAAGLANQRLPVPSAHDEIRRLAVTLNAMLDRIDSATARQRTFVGDAAHELRSPLASLRVQLEVAGRVGLVGDLPSLVDEVLLDVDRLERLVNDLLALARLDEAGGQLARRDPVALDELVADVMHTYPDARVPVHADGMQPATVAGDADALRRVAINLIDNAVRFARSEVEVSVTGGAQRVTVTVTDDGPGLPPEERERVFDRFYRVHASRSRESGGTGLGLAIVRDVVRAHGGSVRLTSRDDGRPGLVAEVVLPAVSGSA